MIEVEITNLQDWRAKFGEIVGAVGEAAERGCRVIIESLDIISWEQRKLLNATCGDIANQVRLNERGQYVNCADAPFGKRLRKDDWRGVFVAVALGQQSVPHPDGDGYVILSKSSKRLSKRAFNTVMETIWAFGAHRRVAWTDPKWQSMVAAYGKAA